MAISSVPAAIIMMVRNSAGKARAWLHAQGVVQSETESDQGHRLTVRWTARQKAAFAAIRA